ncbi:MAG TPA: ATP-binding protein, partial [Thermoplasmata archaeon]|nr:ATP-binding protein [Thermoplasmata archaeon]
QEVALLDVRRAIQFASHLSMPVVGIIENMSVFICPHCGKETHLFSSGGGEKVAEETGILFLGKVPFDPEVVSSGDLGRPFVVENPNGKTAKSFNRIIQNILNSLNNLKEV